MRLLFWPLIFTLFLLVGAAYMIDPYVHPPPKVVYKLPIHKTLYIDRHTLNDEMFFVMEAAIEWTQVTNGQVVIDVKRLPQPGLDMKDAIIILNVTADHPQIIILDSMNEHTTLGFSDVKRGYGLDSILLVEQRIRDAEFSVVVMHEIGHNLGLEHIKGIDGINTLMYSNIDEGSHHITSTDLYFFCKLYHCDESQFHELR